MMKRLLMLSLIVVFAFTGIAYAGVPDNSVTTRKIRNGAVYAAKIAARAVTEDKIAPGAVTNTRIANLSVTESKITDGAVTSAKIADGTIVNDDISDTAAIADSKLAIISTAGKVANTALSASVSLLGQTIESAEITDGTIVNDDISATAAIADSKLAIISTAGKVANTALSADVSLLGQTIESAEITDGAVTTAKIAAGAVTMEKMVIKWGTVTIDPPSIAAGSSTDVTTAVAGLATTDKILVMCQDSLETSLVAQAASASAADTLRVRIQNVHNAAIDGAVRTWLWVKLP